MNVEQGVVFVQAQVRRLVVDQRHVHVLHLPGLVTDFLKMFKVPYYNN